jgi:MFS family permease
VVAAAALAISWTVLPASRQRSHPPLDVPGAVLIGAALLALLLAITEGNSWGWSSGPALALLVISLVLTMAWVWRERTTPHPLVDLSLLRHGAVFVTDVTGLLMAVGMYMFLPLLADFVQTPPSTGYGFGSSVVVVGLMLVPFSVLSACMSRVAAALSRQIGAQRVLPIGAMLMAAGTLFFVFSGAALWQAFFAAGLMGVGVGFGFAVMPGLIVRSVPPEETGSALAFAQVIRFIGFALGSGISAAILAAHTQPDSLLPERSGFSVAMVAGAGVCVLAALVSVWLGRSAGSGPPGADGASDGSSVAPTVEVVAE